MGSFKRALRDTFNGQLVALVVLVLGGGLSLAFLYITESATVAVEEIPYVAGALFGAFGALFFLFFWNLACAPYRIQRDLAERLRVENLSLRDGSAETAVLSLQGKGDGSIPVDGGNACSATVTNLSTNVQAIGVRVTLTKVLLDNGHTLNLRKKLLCQSVGKGPININSLDSEEYKYFTILHKAKSKGLLGAFEDGTYQPLDAGEHLVLILATAQNATPVLAVCRIKIDDRGFGRFSGFSHLN